jgi:hypothetical protein
MEEMLFRIKGIVPLLMHCNQAANPLGRYAQVMKPLTSKRNKTDQDHKELSRIEWEAGLYLRDGLVVMPSENIDRMLWEAAKKTKNGKKWKEGAMIGEDYSILQYPAPKIKVTTNGQIPNPELDKYYDALKDQALVKTGSSTVLRTRPIFHEWELEFTIMFDENVLNRRTLIDIVTTAGKYIGLCEKRPRLGRFEVIPN